MPDLGGKNIDTAEKPRVLKTLAKALWRLVREKSMARDPGTVGDEFAKPRKSGEMKEEDLMSVFTRFSEVSVGLVTRYVDEPDTLSADDKSRVEYWIEKYPHVRKDVEHLRRWKPYFEGPQSTLSND